MAGSQSVYAGHAIDLVGLASPYGAMLVLGQSVWWAEVVQAIVTLGVAGLVAVVWRRGLSLPVRAAVLLAAIPVATPIVMFYDLMLSGVAIAWLVRAGQTNGFSPWSKTLLAVAFILPLLTGNVAGANNWLLAPATALLVLGLAAAAARREFTCRRETAPAAPAAGAAAILG
jgi:alpha-1,2-mannosyltransferase